jgi:hypothetical protein
VLTGSKGFIIPNIISGAFLYLPLLFFKNKQSKKKSLKFFGFFLGGGGRISSMYIHVYHCQISGDYVINIFN